jgi:hypothetical protein
MSYGVMHLLREVKYDVRQRDNPRLTTAPPTPMWQLEKRLGGAELERGSLLDRHSVRSRPADLYTCRWRGRNSGGVPGIR